MTAGPVAAPAAPEREPAAPSFWRRPLRLSPAVLFGLLVLEAVVVLTFIRLRIGVDLSDESFYAAVAQRFALGDQPYADEVNLRQNAGILTAPLYWCYLKVVGSTDGVIYFLRLVYFAMQLALGWSVYRLAARRVGLAFALLAAAVPVAFIPFMIPACSYNTIGSSLFALGCMVGLRRLLEPGPKSTMAIAGLIHGLACFAYPPLAPAVLLFTAAAHFALPAERKEGGRRLALWHLAGLVLVGAAAAAFLLPSILAGLGQTMAYEGATTRPRDLEKLFGIFGSFVELSPYSPLWLVAAVASALLVKRHPRSRVFVFSTLLVIAAWWCSRAHPIFAEDFRKDTPPLHMAIYVGLLGALPLLAFTRGSPGRTLLMAGWIPSAAAGLLYAMASDNTGSMNAGLGLLSAALVTMIAIPLAEPSETSRASRAALLVSLALVPLGMELSNFTASYRDVAPLLTDTTVRIGPFKGLRSSGLKAAACEELTVELRALAVPGERMLAYYDIPSAYLFTGARPAFPTTWTDSRARMRALLPYYERHRTGRGLVFVLEHPKTVSFELESFVEVPSRLLKDGEWYRIYREPPPPW